MMEKRNIKSLIARSILNISDTTIDLHHSIEFLHSLLVKEHERYISTIKSTFARMAKWIETSHRGLYMFKLYLYLLSTPFQ